MGLSVKELAQLDSSRGSTSSVLGNAEVRSPRRVSRMRRRLQQLLPIVLIALAVQILAPVVACFAAGAIASDPLQSVGICHDGGSTGAGDQTAAHTGCCALCCLGHAAALADTPRSAFVLALSREPERVIWSDRTLQCSESRTGSNTQARAPPQLT
jgi:DUF2946 family protein